MVIVYVEDLNILRTKRKHFKWQVATSECTLQPYEENWSLSNFWAAYTYNVVIDPLLAEKNIKVQNDIRTSTQTNIPDFQLCYPW